eukprot:comp23716_c1_seq2/m.40831 comp23716_c1_seq2/g.40831  ORF comp23716_c1_seq2/g.40831 comp23716_c1_seq2/m.40831 type:complete len:775 (-) comp23716_c1_seq2:294-2618(-)
MGRIRIPDCREDTPLLRSRIAYFEEATDVLEKRLAKMADLAKRRFELEQRQLSVCNSIAEELMAFAGQELGTEDKEIEIPLKKFAACLKNLEEHREMMAQQMNTALRLPFEKLIRTDFAFMKDSKQGFEKTSTSLNSALDKFGQTKKQDFPSMLETANSLFEARRQFHRSSCHYAMALNTLHVKKKIVYLEKVLDYMTSQLAYFQLGYGILHSLEPIMTDLFQTLKKLKKDFEEELSADNDDYNHDIKLMDERRSDAFIRFQTRDIMRNPPPPPPKPITDTTKSGYLMYGEKKSYGMSWSRYFFYIIDGLLLQQTSYKDPPQLLVNLILCTVKPSTSVDRNFCFSVISPNKSFSLQAESSEEMESWMQVLANATAAALQSQTTVTDEHPLNSTSAYHLEDGEESREEDRTINVLPLLQAIRAKNPVCAECSAPNPDWASLNLGVLMCIECSGIHRSLGVYISQVRSITLDRWRPDMLTVLRETDNAAVNRKYESLVPAAEVKPTEKSTRAEKEDWIQRKYVDLAFMPADMRLRELERRADEMQRVEEEKRRFADLMKERARAEEERRQAEVVQLYLEAEHAANQNTAIGNSPRQPLEQQGEGEKIMDLFKKLWSDMTDATPESPPLSPNRRLSNIIASTFPPTANTQSQGGQPHVQQQNVQNPAPSAGSTSDERQQQTRASRFSFSSTGKAKTPSSPKKETVQPIENDHRPPTLVAGTVREKPLEQDDWFMQAASSDTDPINIELKNETSLESSRDEEYVGRESEGVGPKTKSD